MLHCFCQLCQLTLTAASVNVCIAYELALYSACLGDREPNQWLQAALAAVVGWGGSSLVRQRRRRSWAHGQGHGAQTSGSSLICRALESWQCVPFDFICARARASLRLSS